MKPSRLALLLVVVALLSASLTLLYWSASRAGPAPLDRAQVPYLFVVNETSGFDLGTDIFRLGSVAPGLSSYRVLALGHPDASSLRVGFRGDGAEWLTADPWVASLENGTANVTIRVHVPEDAEFGRYEGVIRVFFYEENIVNN